MNSNSADFGATDDAMLDCLQRDFLRFDIRVTDTVWDQFRNGLDFARFERDTVIESATEIAGRWLFVCSGIVASRQTHTDGEISIARFFERGQMCANLTSVWAQSYSADDLLAMTAVEALVIPDSLFRDELINGEDFGRYFRHKAMETLCFDKEIMSAKTRIDTETRYRFLEQHYASVLENVRQRDIAAFIGITPQGLSRFKRHRHK
ncbi:MAG: cyclic nucleotide-binding domain-containing protein [Pseudomonadota bacterium]